MEIITYSHVNVLINNFVFFRYICIGKSLITIMPPKKSAAAKKKKVVKKTGSAKKKSK